MDIKQQLLDTSAVLDNKYLDKYITLINENKTTKKETFITQKHHIIPRYVFKSLNLSIDNSSYNIVNLKFSDHLLAHYYLMKCSSNPIYEFSNASAVIRLTGSPHSIGSEDWLKRNSSKLNEVYARRIKLFSLLHHNVQGNKNPRATRVFKYNLNGDLLFTFDTIKDAALTTHIKQDSLRSMLSRNKFVLIKDFIYSKIKITNIEELQAFVNAKLQLYSNKRFKRQFVCEHCGKTYSLFLSEKNFLKAMTHHHYCWACTKTGINSKGIAKSATTRQKMREAYLQRRHTL